MNISEVFIRRPIATTLAMLGITVAGIMGYLQLPVSALPQVDYPTIVISTLLPGASAETIAATVTTPLERQFGQIPSLGQMTSISSFGSSQITLQFALDRNIDAAEQDVQAAINAATNLLPATLPTPPIYSKSNPADVPILTLSVSSDTLPLSVVDDYADSILAQKISQVTGVGLVSLGGGQKPAVRVQIDPQALAGANLTLEDVRQALVAANINAPKGNIDGLRQAYALATDDQLLKAEQYRPLILAYANGAPIRLRDIGSIVDGVENAQVAGWAQGKRAIILNIQRQPGANIIQVADKIKALLPHLLASSPQGVDVEILSDRTETVRASVKDVQFTLMLTIVLVIAVIYVFLHSFTATLIPSITVPLSLITTFGLMYLLDFSLDNLSLMALTISTGFIVDDAIVMIENISRFIEMGKSPIQAAMQGSKQIGFTIISLTVSLVAVLIPLLFMNGIIGRLFQEFALVLAMTIGVSAVLSLTLTPMMCALLLKHDANQQISRFHQACENLIVAMREQYDHGLRWVLAHMKTTLLIQICTVLLTVGLAWYVPKGFFPQQDTGLLLGVSEASADVSFSQMMQLQRQLSQLIAQDPDVEKIASFIGSDGTNPTANTGRFTISLRSLEKRKDTIGSIIARIMKQAEQVSGITLYLQPVQDLQIDSRISRTQYQYTLDSADSKALKIWGPRILEALSQLPTLQDVASDQSAKGLQLHLHIDRDAASRLGVSPQDIDNVLYDAFGQRIVSTIFTQINQYRVILEVKPEFQDDPHALDLLYVKSQSGASVALSQFITVTREQTDLSINHQGQFPSVTISFNLADNVSLGKAVSSIEKTVSDLDMPTSVHPQFVGTPQAFSESLSSESILIFSALIVVYIVLGILYESYIHPITILSTLPSAGVGALAALILCASEFNIISLIGVILLIGIVKKNAIMMIDFALEAEREHEVPPEKAIYQACLLRFRPIMMTTLAALLGGIPLAVGTGIGAELRQPMGIAIVGGLCISQVLTLYTTPVIYLYMDRFAKWFKSKIAVSYSTVDT